jgi:hypothetical protein
VFLARTTHNEIIGLYEARLREAEARLADMSAERNFYRNAWLERLGLKFPIPRPAEVTAITPSAPVTVPSELEQRKTFRLDKSEWTMDDHELYEDYWVKPALQKAVPLEEVDYHYHQTHGNQLPLKVFLDSVFPIT